MYTPARCSQFWHKLRTPRRAWFQKHCIDLYISRLLNWYPCIWLNYTQAKIYYQRSQLSTGGTRKHKRIFPPRVISSLFDSFDITSFFPSLSLSTPLHLSPKSAYPSLIYQNQHVHQRTFVLVLQGISCSRGSLGCLHRNCSNPAAYQPQGSLNRSNYHRAACTCDIKRQRSYTTDVFSAEFSREHDEAPRRWCRRCLLWRVRCPGTINLDLSDRIQMRRSSLLRVLWRMLLIPSPLLLVAISLRYTCPAGETFLEASEQIRTV